MGKPFIDLTNQTFNYWTVTGPHKSMPRPSGKGSNRTHWFCTCRCGNTAWVDATNLRQDISKSCGCKPKPVTTGKGSPAAIGAARANRKHGMSRTSLYHRYHAMLQRCYDTNVKEYKWYGGKGITVCDHWRESFENFYTDMAKSYYEGASLERDDVTAGYCLENCRWIPRREQAWNKSTTVRLPSGDRLRRFCFEHGLDYDAYYYQIVKKGLTLTEALDLFKVTVIESIPDITY